MYRGSMYKGMTDMIGGGVARKCELCIKKKINIRELNLIILKNVFLKMG